MGSNKRELDLDQWVTDYLRSDNDGTLTKILRDEKFIESWLLAKARRGISD